MRLAKIKRFRRNQIISTKEALTTGILKLEKILTWLINFGKLIHPRWESYSTKCKTIIHKFYKLYSKFACRAADYDEDDRTASDSYDDDFDCSSDDDNDSN